MRDDAIIADIEEAFVAHWSLLGQWPGARLVEEGGVLLFETELAKLPYNGVIRTRIEGDPSNIVERVVTAYAERPSDFFWVVHPRDTPDNLPDVLRAGGLELVETATGMSLELTTWEPAEMPATSVELLEVADDAALREYTEVAIAYWELDEEDRDHVQRLNRHWFGARARGHRWIARDGGRTIGKAYLSVAGPPGVASIYGMSVRPEARGLGIAGGLTQTLLRRAKSLGCRRVVLHSSEMAVGVYRRAGFVERCSMLFFATAPIWSHTD